MNKNKISDSLTQFFWLPLLLGVIISGVVSVIFSVSIILIIRALISSVLVAVKLENKYKNQKLEASDVRVIDKDEHQQKLTFQIEHFSNVITRVIEVSNRQIESSRKQTEEAITEMSLRFGVIVERLNNALDAAKHANASVPNEGKSILTNVFENSRSQLNC